MIDLYSMETGLLAVIVILMSVIVYQAIVYHLDRSRAIRAHDNLMDRLMAQDFNAYLASKRVQQKPKRRTLRELAGWKQKSDQQDIGDGQTGTQDNLGLPVN